MLYPIFRERFTSQHPVGRLWGASPASVSGASRLMRLPNELLVQIWTYMSPKDIESLSLVNRHFHNLGHQYIQEHRRLKQRYLRVENALPYGWDSPVAEPSPKKLIGHSLIRLFTDLYENPSARGYVEEIIINDWMQSWSSRENCRKAERERLKDTKTSLHDAEAHINHLITKYKYLQSAIMDYRWDPARSIDQIMEGDETDLLALLLTIAPNVHTIHFKAYRDRPRAIMALFRAVVGAIAIVRTEANAANERIPFLTQLSEVTFNARDSGTYFDMSALHAFAILPSVRQLHAYHVWEEEPLWHGAIPCFEEYFSNVRDITLSYVSIYWYSLYHLLRLCKRLQSFVYEPCDLHTYNGTHYRFAPDKIREALFENARHSLRLLKIHSHDRECTYMGSFKEFQVLATLDTDWGLLRNDSKPGRQMLTDTLPTSIEKIHLVSGIGSIIDVSIDALQHLIDSRTQYFPALKAIELKHTRLPQAVEIELVENAGRRAITITFDRSVNPDVELDEENEEDEEGVDIQWFNDEGGIQWFNNNPNRNLRPDGRERPLERYVHYQKPD